MDFSLSKEHEQFAETFAKFCREKIAPRGKATDAAGVLSKENWDDLVEVGFF